MDTKKEQLIKDFDPNSLGESGNLYGLPFDEQTADLVIIPVPWDVTVSYTAGTIDGSKAVLNASAQVDLFQKDIPDAWKMGACLLNENMAWRETSLKLRDKAVKYLEMLEEGSLSPEMDEIRGEIDRAGAKLKEELKVQVISLLDKGKMVACLGGDHSTPLGYMEALAEKMGSFGILQIDAHADLRKAYEGFNYSHASITYNALQNEKISKVIQVGIRDFCEEEHQYMQAHSDRVKVYFDEDMRALLYKGTTFDQLCTDIVNDLPEQVYVSFDIDGLDPKLCPNTGTPVPGGFEFDQAMYLIKKVVLSGRKIIGFDLSEVAPGEGNDEWDGNVGARVLYRLINLMGVSQGKLKFS